MIGVNFDPVAISEKYIFSHFSAYIDVLGLIPSDKMCTHMSHQIVRSSYTISRLYRPVLRQAGFHILTIPIF